MGDSIWQHRGQVGKFMLSPLPHTDGVPLSVAEGFAFVRARSNLLSTTTAEWKMLP